MTSDEAINQTFIPYPSTFPSISFVVNEHECEKLSTCCGATSNEYIDEFCNACNEYAEFECSKCEVGDN